MSDTPRKLAEKTTLSQEEMQRMFQAAKIEITDYNQTLSNSVKTQLLNFLENNLSLSKTILSLNKNAETSVRRKTSISTLDTPGKGAVTVTRKSKRLFMPEQTVQKIVLLKQVLTESMKMPDTKESVATLPNQDATLRPSQTVLQPKVPQEPQTSTVSKPKRIESPKQSFEKPRMLIKKEISISDSITPVELGQKMAVKTTMILSRLSKMGVTAKAEDVIDQDTAVLLVEEMGHTAQIMASNPLELELQESISKHQGPSLPRAPIVTIMGHVNHGKTSLLDKIRNTKIADHEAGKITQHIGAYHIKTSEGIITFLDTPGHAAFTAMRARGAQLTDIVVLVIAADDGVQPQTIEAIQHAQAAHVPIVVAINKIDKAAQNFEKIQQQLAQLEQQNLGNLMSEDWGGDTQFVSLSAKTGVGIDQLLEKILLQAEMLELKAPITGPAQGIIIESKIAKGQGAASTIILKQGTLHQGDVLLAGTTYGKIKALRDEQGKIIKEIGPSLPVEVLGLSTPPAAGASAVVVSNERTARKISEDRISRAKDAQFSAQNNTPFELSDLSESLLHSSESTLNVIIKADVHGSVEALGNAVTELSSTHVKINNLVPPTLAVGPISESDVNLALTSNALIFAFNVKADAMARKLATQENLTIYYSSTIYELLDQVKQNVTGLLIPQIQENILGEAKIKEIFRSAKTGTIAGCHVIEGHIQRNQPVRILRSQNVIHEGILSSLRRFTEDVNEVSVGTECGISIKNFNDLKIGDIVVSYEKKSVTPTLFE